MGGKTTFELTSEMFSLLDDETRETIIFKLEHDYPLPLDIAYPSPPDRTVSVKSLLVLGQRYLSSSEDTRDICKERLGEWLRHAFCEKTSLSFAQEVGAVLVFLQTKESFRPLLNEFIAALKSGEGDNASVLVNRIHMSETRLLGKMSPLAVPRSEFVDILDALPEKHIMRQSELIYVSPLEYSSFLKGMRTFDLLVSANVPVYWRAEMALGSLEFVLNKLEADNDEDKVSKLHGLLSLGLVRELAAPAKFLVHPEQNVPSRKSGESLLSALLADFPVYGNGIFETCSKRPDLVEQISLSDKSAFEAWMLAKRASGMSLPPLRRQSV